jgi:hypothetical protein
VADIPSDGCIKEGAYLLTHSCRGLLQPNPVAGLYSSYSLPPVVTAMLHYDLFLRLYIRVNFASYPDECRPVKAGAGSSTVKLLKERRPVYSISE